MISVLISCLNSEFNKFMLSNNFLADCQQHWTKMFCFLFNIYALASCLTRANPIK